jgi:hypothetical protein
MDFWEWMLLLNGAAFLLLGWIFWQLGHWMIAIERELDAFAAARGRGGWRGAAAVVPAAPGRAMTRPLSRVLGEIVGIAERLPAATSSAIWDPRFDELRLEIGAADRRPAVGERLTDAARLWLDVAKLSDTHPARGTQWKMVAGVLLPMVRDDLWLAINQEREEARDTR